MWQLNAIYASEDAVATVETVGQRIISIRQQSVILDADVAERYGIKTKRISEAV